MICVHTRRVIGSFFWFTKKRNGMSLVKIAKNQGRDCGAVLNPFCYVDFHSKSSPLSSCSEGVAVPLKN